jgi:hypothetical protein
MKVGEVITVADLEGAEKTENQRARRRRRFISVMANNG